MFYQNQLGGTISPKIRQLSNLKELYIHSNRFEGTLPMSSLQALSKLEVFWIEDNRFQGPFFDALSSWPRLKMLGVSDLPGMDGGTTLPTEIGELTRLEYITLGDMHPRLPTEIGNLWNLGSLSIRKPRLSGADTQSATIPTEIGQLTNLWSLTLVGDDLLTGTIPTEVGLLTNLKHLGIRESHIGGQFPSELGLLTKLTGFQVRQLRDVHGTVPSELGNIALGPLREFVLFVLVYTSSYR
jgi:Leucine-rich repeat (LRR) protein